MVLGNETLQFSIFGYMAHPIGISVLSGESYHFEHVPEV